MPDINLLPEDLKKKQEKTLKNRGDFNLNEIEFTEGEKLKKEIEISPIKPEKNKLGRWFKPKVDNKLKIKENYNKIINTNFIPKVDNKQEEVKEESKISESFSDSSGLNKKMNNVELKDLKPSNQNNNNKIEKKKNNSFKVLIDKFKGKFNKKQKEATEKEEGLDVNLLPFGSNVPTTKRMISVLIITFILASSLIIMIYFAYFIYKDKVVKDYSILGNELDSYMEEIKKYDDLIKETSSWQVKVAEIENLLNKHIYWTKFFEKLEENTLPGVQFIGFAGSIDSAIILEATAPNYQTISKQWIRLENAKDFVEKVDISGAEMFSSQDSINISFSLTLNFVDDIFYSK